jgi:DNA-binding transcriptional ArsR family regulator
MQATTFAALGEPSRLEIVELLRRRPFSVGDIADTLGIRQPQVSKHLKVLRDAGVVDVKPVARRRIYHLSPAAFAQLGDWVASFEALWEQRLDSLEDVLTEMRAARQDTQQTTNDDEEGSP